MKKSRSKSPVILPGKPDQAHSGTMPAELRKPPEAIFVKARGGRVTLAMHKAYNVLIARAAEQPRNQTTYRVSLRELGVDIQFDGSHNIEVLKDMLRRLNVTQVEWGLVHADSEVWGVSTMLAGVQIKRGELEYSFAPQIKDKLLDPQIFARIDLRLMAGFRTRSGLALYEACYRYITNPSGVTVKMPWEKWRAALCENAGPKEWRYFHRDVIKPAVREVNAIVPDMEVETILYYGAGGKVTDLQFRVSRKRQRDLALESKPDVALNSELIKRLAGIGIQELAARRLLIEHDEDKIATALTVTERRMRNKRANPLENPVAFFHKALAEGYQPALPARQNDHVRIEDQRRQEEAQKEANRLGSEAYKAYEALDEQTKNKILGRFVEDVVHSDAVLLAELSRKGLGSSIVKGHFKAWLLKQGIFG